MSGTWLLKYILSCRAVALLPVKPGRGGPGGQLPIPFVQSQTQWERTNPAAQHSWFWLLKYKLYPDFIEVGGIDKHRCVSPFPKLSPRRL